MEDNSYIFFCQIATSKANSFVSYINRLGFNIKIKHRHRQIVDDIEIVFNDNPDFFQEFTEKAKQYLEL